MRANRIEFKETECRKSWAWDFPCLSWLYMIFSVSVCNLLHIIVVAFFCWWTIHLSHPNHIWLFSIVPVAHNSCINGSDNKLKGCHWLLVRLMPSVYFRWERDWWKLKINYLDELEWLVKREIGAKTSKSNDIQVKPGWNILCLLGYSWTRLGVGAM